MFEDTGTRYRGKSKIRDITTMTAMTEEVTHASELRQSEVTTASITPSKLFHSYPFDKSFPHSRLLPTRQSDFTNSTTVLRINSAHRFFVKATPTIVEEAFIFYP